MLTPAQQGSLTAWRDCEVVVPIGQNKCMMQCYDKDGKAARPTLHETLHDAVLALREVPKAQRPVAIVAWVQGAVAAAAYLWNDEVNGKACEEYFTAPMKCDVLFSKKFLANYTVKRKIETAWAEAWDAATQTIMKGGAR
jgi:hypothetical protein